MRQSSYITCHQAPRSLGTRGPGHLPRTLACPWPLSDNPCHSLCLPGPPPSRPLPCLTNWRQVIHPADGQWGFKCCHFKGTGHTWSVSGPPQAASFVNQTCCLPTPPCCQAVWRLTEDKAQEAPVNRHHSAILEGASGKKRPSLHRGYNSQKGNSGFKKRDYKYFGKRTGTISE